MPQIAIGEKIPLVVFLEDEEENLFPLATLKDDSQNEIGQVALSSAGGGEYTDKSFTMPSTDFVTAEIRIYSDSGHTVLSRYKPVASIFTKDQAFALILDQVIAKLNGLNLPGASINANLVQNITAAKSKTDQSTSVKLDEQKSSAFVRQEQKTKVGVNDNEIAVKACKKC